MTHETKYLIELADILGLEFECSKCKTKISFALDAARTLLFQCPGCNEDWMNPGTMEHDSMRKLLGTFRNAAEAVEGRAFTVKLQISAPPKP